MCKCNFAYSGTYGHECGKPATHAALKRSELTVSGIFYGRRCPEHTNPALGGENNGVFRFESFDASIHVNEWWR
jgi:hypothetical protein